MLIFFYLIPPLVFPEVRVSLIFPVLWIVPFTWSGHWFDALILTASSSVSLIETLWFWLMVFTFEIGPTAGATGQQGMFTPLRHLIPPPVYPMVRFSPFISLVIPTCVSRLITLWYLSHFIGELNHKEWL
jgi:hypothetical protein